MVQPMVTGDDATIAAVDADLSSVRFLVGSLQKRWRIVSFDPPVLFVAISGSLYDDKHEYIFRFDLTGFPGAAPEVRIWDLENNCLLPLHARPKGSERISAAFKEWGSQTVYRPWERLAGSSHSDWANLHPELLWHPNRGLTFILEDLHGLITSSALAQAEHVDA